MAKQNNEEREERRRRSRKEILIERKRKRQLRSIRLAVAGVVGLVLLVIIAAVVVEFYVIPNRPVAIVNGETISLNRFRERVRYERAQRIIFLENQYEAFGGNVGIIQQFARQMIDELLDPEGLGQTILDQMIDEATIRQEAEARGIDVTDEDVDQELAEGFNYYGGESPPPTPSPTETVMPTPSLTPIPTAVITDVIPTNTPLPSPTAGPSPTSQPTPTAVSAEAYQEQLDALLSQFAQMGVSEEAYRRVIQNQIYRERLMESLAEEEGLEVEAEQASFFVLVFNSEEAANEAAAMIGEEGFLPVWNEIRSTPPDPETGQAPTATELLWRTQQSLVTNVSQSVAEAAFSLPLNVPSQILSDGQDNQEGGDARHFIIQVSGREIRPLSESELQNRKRQLLAGYIDARQAGNVEQTNFWRDRVPTQPVLDPKFLVRPTPPPGQGQDQLPLPQATVAPGEGN